MPNDSDVLSIIAMLSSSLKRRELAYAAEQAEDRVGGRHLHPVTWNEPLSQNIYITPAIHLYNLDAETNVVIVLRIIFISHKWT